MDSKNRFLTAMRNGIPDRVPCTPDISNYIPCKHTGLPFWDIYFSEDISLWEAYMAASEYYGIDQWLASACDIPVDYSNREVVVKKRLSFDDSRDAMIARFSVTVNSAVVQARSKICNDVRHRRCYDLHQGESERSKTHRL